MIAKSIESTIFFDMANVTINAIADSTDLNVIDFPDKYNFPFS